MHALLAKYLEKIGYKNVSELSTAPMPDGSPTDRQVFDSWNRILSSQEEVTVEKIAEFCHTQLNDIEAHMKNPDNTPEKNTRLVLLHTVYRSLGEALKAPQQERETLEKYLTGLLHA